MTDRQYAGLVRRFLMPFGAAVLVAALVAPPALAGRLFALESGSVTKAQRDGNVEPFDGVVNRTGCLWDPDDQENTLEQGYLDPGTITKTGCLIAHSYQVWGTINGIFAFWSISNHPNLRFVVDSPKPLSVSVCYEPQGWCRTITASPNAGYAYHYEGCIAGPRYDNDSTALAEIPNSNGGIGVRSTYTLSVTNDSKRRVKPVWVIVRGGNDQNNCPDIPYVWSFGPDYSFQFQQP